jgi:hypothetical protein
MTNEYLVKDLYEASFLYAKGVNLIELRDAGKYMWFVFENQNRCENLAQEYWSGSAVINAKALTDAQRTLKDRLFSNR